MAQPGDPLVTMAGSSHGGRSTLLAHYRTLPDVRHAIDALEAEGIDGDDLALVGFSESWSMTFEDDPGGPLRLAIYDAGATVDDAEARTYPLEIVPDPPATV